MQIHIIKRIFYNFGISSELKISNNYLLNDDNLCSYSLPVEYENENLQKSIWSAELHVGSTAIRLMLSDLSDNEFHEFALAFDIADLSQYGIRLSSDPEDEGDFCVLVNGKWVPTTIAIQANVLSGIEQLQSVAFNWKKCEQDKDLYKSLIDFINIENN